MKKFLKPMMTALAVLFVLRFYFIRELLTAELLFALGFTILLVLGGLTYLFGSVAECSMEFAATGVRIIGDWTSRVFGNLEEMSSRHSGIVGRAVVLMSAHLHQVLHSTFYQDAKPLNPPKPSSH